MFLCKGRGQQNTVLTCTFPPRSGDFYKFEVPGLNGPRQRAEPQQEGQRLRSQSVEPSSAALKCPISPSLTLSLELWLEGSQGETREMSPQ